MSYMVLAAAGIVLVFLLRFFCAYVSPYCYPHFFNEIIVEAKE